MNATKMLFSNFITPKRSMNMKNYEWLCSNVPFSSGYVFVFYLALRVIWNCKMKQCQGNVYIGIKQIYFWLKNESWWLEGWNKKYPFWSRDNIKFIFIFLYHLIYNFLYFLTWLYTAYILYCKTKQFSPF